MKQIIKSEYLVIVSFILLGQTIAAQEVSRTFKLRYFTKDTKANGETDFKEETEYFDTEQRVEYLSKYAEVAKRFFDDPNLDTKVVLNLMKYPGAEPRSIKWNLLFPTQRVGVLNHFMNKLSYLAG